jgi:2-iminobutanoate/2-iminopropanoate deaminase
MTRSVSATDRAPQPSGHYSQAVRIGPLVWTAGQGGFEPTSRQLVSNDVAAQTHQSLLNCQAALEACGATLEDVVRAQVFLSDLGDRTAMNESYQRFWPSEPPARTTVGATLPPGMLVEIDLTAYVPEARASS